MKSIISTVLVVLSINAAQAASLDLGGLGGAVGGISGIGGKIGDILNGGLGQVSGEVNSYGQTFPGIGAGVGHTADECLQDAKVKAEAAAMQACQSGSVVTKCILTGPAMTTKSPSKISDFTAYGRSDVDGDNAPACHAQVVGKAERAAVEQCQSATQEPCSVTSAGKVIETSDYKVGASLFSKGKKYTMCRAVASAGPQDRNKLICEAKAQAKKQGLVKP